MNVLVTGGCGFIGSNLVRQLLLSGHSVHNIDKLTYAGNLESLADVSQHPAYRFSQIDIASVEEVNRVVRDAQPDWILHLAAESHVDRSIDGPQDFVMTNLVGTFSMLQAAKSHYEKLDESGRARFRFIHVSTDEVFGSLGSTGSFREATPYDPRSPYSACKAGSDHLARAWSHTYGLPVIVTNCSNNYGPYQFPEKLIPVVILKCLRGEPIPVYGSGENIRDWLYVKDHCHALQLVAEKGRPGETYNIGGNNEMRNIDLVRLLCAIMDEKVDRMPGSVRPAGSSAGDSSTNARYSDLITFVTDRPGHDARYAIDASKIRNELSWQPNSDHARLFRDTVQWYLDNEAWWQRILSGDYKLDRQGIQST
tara:strand:- start:96101 stop:97201 length:1101 start_codon:yes stop_codon:yes gene_type:complete